MTKVTKKDLLTVELCSNHQYFFMKTNMGTADRIIRIIAAIAVTVLYFTNQISGIPAIILLVMAANFILTPVAGFCPLYRPVHFRTNKKQLSL